MIVAVLTLVVVLNAAPQSAVSSPAYAISDTKHVDVVSQITNKPTSYRVTTGDYLAKIAQEHNTTWQVLFNKNLDIKDANLIYVDQEIQIPAKDEVVPERTVEAPEAPVTHVEAPQTAPSPEVVQSTVSEPEPVVEAPVEQTQTPAPAITSGCGDNYMANYIYMHESGCNTGAVNPGGCFGIGQDCNGVLLSQCGYDYACQNAYFTNYATSRYGGWSGAYSFWLGNGWW